MQFVAAQKLNVSRATICRFIQKHHDIQIILQEIEDENCDIAESNLLIALRDGKDWAIRYYLENKGQARGYGQRKLAFRDGEGNMTVPAQLVSDGRLSLADWEARYGLEAQDKARAAEAADDPAVTG